VPDASYIRTSGGLLTQAFIDALREPSTSRPHTGPSSFGLPWANAPTTDRKLEDDIAGAWDLLKERWDALTQTVESLDELDVSTTRERWLLPLAQLLDFDPQYQRADLRPSRDDSFRFPVSHRGWTASEELGDGPALHLLAPSQDLDQRQGTGRGPKAKSPHDMLQVFLNVSEPDLWAILSNGKTLRLLRDYHHTFSKGFVEFDLESIFEGRNYADFRALYRLCHASRFRPVREEDAALPLEAFHETARATGVKIGEDLRPQVRDAIEDLGNGFLQGDPELIEQLQGDPDAARDFYSEILRVVYRVLFLLFAEQRELIPDRTAPQKQLYWNDYSLTALRERAEGRPPSRDDYTDLWHGLQVTFRMVRDGAGPVGVFGYNGELFNLDDDAYLRDRACDNASLLRAIRSLTLIEREGVLQRISYLDLGVEELGSIYEALLDYTPRVTEHAETIEDTDVPASTFILDPRGLQRKQSGSYYTPDSLVNELVKSALLPVMRDRLEAAGLPVVEEEGLGEVTSGMLEEYADLSEEERSAGEEALLSMTVCDPAAGSGHFLVKANNVMGAEVARVRTGDEYPTEEAIREAKRDVLARCIYAVDLNPMAVELCKVSLWINASVKAQPLNFLDHHIKCGNSLIGATPELLKDGVPYEAFDHKRSGTHRERAKALRKRNRQERKEGTEGIGVQLGAFAEGMATEQSVEYRAGDFVQLSAQNPKKAREVYQSITSNPERQKAKLEADAWTAAFFWPVDKETDWAPTYREVFRLQKEGPDAIPGEQAEKIRALSEEHRFFHWHLEFADVFGKPGDDAGGFDVILGNPPWERIKLQQKEFFAVKRPDIAGLSTAAKRKKAIKRLKENGDPLYDEYQDAQHFSEAFSTYLRESGRYELTAVGDVNLYQIFAGLVRQVVGNIGRVGVIVPSGIATDYYTQDYFNAIVDNRELVSLYDFENSAPVFHGVHRSYKFCLLTLTGQRAPAQAIDFAFFLTETDHLAEEDRHFTLTRDELYAINPNTGTCPTFRSKRDAELTQKLYDAAPVLINEAEDENPWGITFSTMFHMSGDSGLFHTREDLEEEGLELVGNRFVEDAETYLPLYEAKMFHQFDNRFATYETTSDSRDVSAGEHHKAEYQALSRYWIDKTKLSRDGNAWLSFRDIARNTDMRTAIFSLLPPIAVGHTAPLVFTDEPLTVTHALVGALNSYCVDYAVRQKLSGTHLTYSIAKQLPVHPPERYDAALLEYIVPRVVELTYTAWDLAAFADDVWSEAHADLRTAIEAQWQANVEATGGGHRGATPPDWVEHSDQAGEPFPHAPFMWNEERRSQLRADLDGLYGHLYGLERDDLAYILDTFPIVEKKDRADHGEYRTKRLVLEAYDRLATTDLVNGTPSASGPTGDPPYALCDADLHDLDDNADPDDVQDDFADLQTAVENEPPALGESDTTTTTTTSTVRSEAFRVGVRRIYEHRCAVCGVDARGPGDGSPIVDAAHIVPKSEGGPDDLRNGLCLCKNHHWAFDQGWFSITDGLTVEVHPDMMEKSSDVLLQKYDGQKLHLPDDERFWPAAVYVAGRRKLEKGTTQSSEP
jgi:hypothetical protein